MMKECIILAGGFGTRLQSVVKDVPKCMAEVANKPFLEYIFNYLENERFNHIILSLGYKSEYILSWLETQNRSFTISYVIESEPLGTGGGIKLAFDNVKSNKAFVVNGDTFFDVSTNDVALLHNKHNADLTIALKPMSNFDRYGSVQLNEEDRIIKFNEKQFCEKGLINGGIYLIDKEIFSKLDLPEKFSFEQDVMESQLQKISIYGCIQDQYFIDIGIPTDFEKANIDFSLGKK